jgi:hypothetical protein
MDDEHREILNTASHAPPMPAYPSLRGGCLASEARRGTGSCVVPFENVI